MPIVWTLLGGYLLILGLMFVFQRSLIYPASKERADLDWARLDGLQEVKLTTADGLELVHWYRPPRDESLPVVVVFHGNAGHMGNRTFKYAFLAEEEGFGLFFQAYRSYGGTPGKPTEDTLTGDAAQSLDWLAEQGISGERLVLYGESLGTGLAVKHGTMRQVGGVVLEAPYSSVAAVAQGRYWFLPAEYLVLDRWDSIAVVDRLTAPLLIMHGERDRVIPFKFGKALFEAAKEPKSAVFIAEGGHIDLLEFPGIQPKIKKFIHSLAWNRQPAVLR